MDLFWKGLFVNNLFLTQKPEEFETLSWVQVLPVACLQYLILQKCVFGSSDPSARTKSKNYEKLKQPDIKKRLL